jgi:hypothetical protein
MSCPSKHLYTRLIVPSLLSCSSAISRTLGLQNWFSFSRRSFGRLLCDDEKVLWYERPSVENPLHSISSTHPIWSVSVIPFTRIQSQSWSARYLLYDEKGKCTRFRKVPTKCVPKMAVFVWIQVHRGDQGSLSVPKDSRVFPSCENFVKLFLCDGTEI